MLRILRSVTFGVSDANDTRVDDEPMDGPAGVHIPISNYVGCIYIYVYQSRDIVSEDATLCTGAEGPPRFVLLPS